LVTETSRIAINAPNIDPNTPIQRFHEEKDAEGESVVDGAIKYLHLWKNLYVKTYI